MIISHSTERRESTVLFMIKINRPVGIPRSTRTGDKKAQQRPTPGWQHRSSVQPEQFRATFQPFQFQPSSNTWRREERGRARARRSDSLFYQQWAACACGYRPISRGRSRSAATSHTTLTTSSAPVPSCCAKGITCTHPQEDAIAVRFPPNRGCRRSMPPALRMPAHPHHHNGLYSRSFLSSTAPELWRSRPRNHSTPEQVLRQPRC